MTEFNLILKTHLAFYRKHPWLMTLFILGLSLGSALLCAIAGLNQEASQRYQTTTSLIEQPVTHLIKPRVGKKYLNGELWLTLKKHGFTSAHPVLEGRLALASGQSIAVKGVDTLSWLTQSISAPKQQANAPNQTHFQLDQLMIDHTIAERLLNESATLTLKSGRIIKHLQVMDDLGPWALADLAFIDDLLDAQGQLSFIELGELTTAQITQVNQLITNQARLIDVQSQPFNALSEAFFFNLTALALLGYVVAAFLSYNAIKLTISARKKLLQQLTVLGCQSHRINLALSTELVLIGAVTALLGAAGGYVIANLLVLDVNTTLVSLYRLDKALLVEWQWQNVAIGFLLNVTALLCIILGDIRQLKQHANTITLAILGLCLSAAWYLFHFASNGLQALLLCFMVLVLFIIATPYLFNGMLKLPITFSNPLWQWLKADTKTHFIDVKVSMIAMLTALGSAIGMQIMVTSFNATLSAHLEKQLSADIYLRGESLDPNMRTTLAQIDGVSRVATYHDSQGEINGKPANLASFSDSWIDYQHITLTSGNVINETTLMHDQCIANEPSHLKFGYKRGDTLIFQQNEKQFRCVITDFFYDYGNTALMVITLENTHLNSTMSYQTHGFTIRLHDDVSLSNFSEQLIEQFAIESSQIIENQRFKNYAQALFSNTFKVTHALNGFIVAIAILSICISLLCLSAKQLKQMAILKTLGVNQQQLLNMKLVQTALLVLMMIFVSIPLGLSLGYVLLTYVMPIAFGWTIALSLSWLNIITVSGCVFVAALLISLLPIIKLARRSPADGVTQL